MPRSALVFAPAAPGHWMLGHADQPVVIPIAPQARSVRVLHQVVGEPDVRFPLEVFSSSLSALCHLRRNGLRLVALGSPLLARVLERCITIERGAIGFERDEYTPRILLDAGELSTKPASAICRDNVAINS